MCRNVAFPAITLVVALAGCVNAFADCGPMQSDVTVNFFTISYDQISTQSVEFPAPAGELSIVKGAGTGSNIVPQGYIDMPPDIAVYDGGYADAEIQFQPNGTTGSFNVDFTVEYQGDSGSPGCLGKTSTLTLEVYANGTVTASTGAFLEYRLLSPLYEPPANAASAPNPLRKAGVEPASLISQTWRTNDSADFSVSGLNRHKELGDVSGMLWWNLSSPDSFQSVWAKKTNISETQELSCRRRYRRLSS